MLLIGVILGLLGATPAAPAEKATKELELLQGNWLMVGLEVNGENVPPEKFQATRLEVKKDRYILNTGKSTHEVTIKINPATSPKSIDMTFADGQNKGETAEGIYKLEGDEWTICRPRLPPHGRPTEFVTKPGTDRFIVVWKREN